MTRIKWAAQLLLCYLLLICPTSHAATLRGQLVSHDPSSIIQSGATFISFSTGQGINIKTSSNLVDWSDSPTPVFSQYPSWVYQKIKSFSGSFWAPDVITMGDWYYLYYSVSSFGSSVSAIGVARTRSLSTPNWEDLGPVVESFGGREELNAIDPSLFRDDDGRVYMTYGSFFGGIGIAEIDQATGKRASIVRKIHGGGFLDVEAPSIVRNGSYYYLFINRGACCKGTSSTYSIQVLRSTSIYGPYVDARTIMPVSDGKYRGPGHLAVFKRNSCLLTSIHYYDVTDGGTPKLDILKMSFVDGWPRLSRDVEFDACSITAPVAEGVYRIVANHSNMALDVPSCSPTAGTSLQQWTWVGSQCQRWKIERDGAGSFTITAQHNYQALDACNTQARQKVSQARFTGARCQKWRIETVGGGDYRVVNVSSGQVLSVWTGALSAGSAVTQDHWLGLTSQTWRMEPVSRDSVPAGVFRLTAAHSGQALDLQNCSPDQGAPIGQWPWNNLPCQKWSIHPTSSGYFQVISISSGLALQVSEGALGNGAYVTQGSASNDGRQDWGFEAMGGGFFRVVNRRSGLALDVSQCSGLAGARIQQWTSLSSACQLWKLESLVSR